ncbi:MAG: O-antigen ligase family protein [Gammaproteobacteria bacterium]|nr:O-antigen ligase family protein [Gammaproteobacteria bacterium]MBU1481681.1 O-antigen ligase family protein [Gammaproteobacteria bacterium]
MNSRTIQPAGPKNPRMMAWAAVAGRWIIPFSLAGIMAGQIFFSAAKYYLGIEHPAWPFWGSLAAGVTLALLRRISSIRFTHLDLTMLAFVSAVAASFMLWGLSNTHQAFNHIAAFMLLPFLAGRLLDAAGITNFFKATIGIAVAAIPLVGFGLLTMPESGLHVDRISTLFTEFADLSTAGVSTIPFVSTVFGLLLVLMASSSGFGPIRCPWSLPFSIAFMGVAVWFLMFAGTRGGILTAMLVSISLLAFAHEISLIRRIVLLLILLLVTAASGMTLPDERKAFFWQVSTIQNEASSIQKGSGTNQKRASNIQKGSGTNQERASNIQKRAGAIQGEADAICDVYGNSPATRVRYYANAIKLFKAAPWLGIGAGNYGFESCGVKEDFASPHSTLLQVLAELGLLGAAVYLLLIGMTLHKLLGIMKYGAERQRLMGRMLASIWFFFLLMDQISGNYFTGFHLYAVAGLISGLASTSGACQDACEPSTSPLST